MADLSSIYRVAQKVSHLNRIENPVDEARFPNKIWVKRFKNSIIYEIKYTMHDPTCDVWNCDTGSAYDKIDRNWKVENDKLDGNKRIFFTWISI